MGFELVKLKYVSYFNDTIEKYDDPVVLYIDGVGDEFYSMYENGEFDGLELLEPYEIYYYGDVWFVGEKVSINYYKLKHEYCESFLPEHLLKLILGACEGCDGCNDSVPYYSPLHCIGHNFINTRRQQ